MVVVWSLVDCGWEEEGSRRLVGYFVLCSSTDDESPDFSAVVALSLNSRTDVLYECDECDECECAGCGSERVSLHFRYARAVNKVHV